MSQLQVVLPPDELAARYPDLKAVAYRADDTERRTPVGAIIDAGPDRYRAEGFASMMLVTYGTLTQCIAALRDYPNTGNTYGDPDTDARLLSV